ncbi:MAG TPA: hypothetical protein DDW50_16495 [Firmicutes bacterium]|jgi:hypothetical protein|nr:hypothetical protein [Bacillota bacterium]
MRIKLLLLVSTLLALIATPAWADEPRTSINLADLTASAGIPAAVMNQALEQPLTINKELQSVLTPDSAWKFLKDLNLQLSTFTTSDGIQSLGLRYTLSKDVNHLYFTHNDSLQTGISYSLDLDGNVAFEENINPDNFLNSNFSVHYFRSQGGVIKTTDDFYTKLNQLEDKIAAIDDQNQLLASPELKVFATALRSQLSDQYYIDFSAIGGLESNQSFTEKQFYYGVQLGLDLKAWNPQSNLAKYNIFDWPFALIRFLSDNDSTFSPRGSAIPAVLFGLDMVDPLTGVVKKLHEDDSFFTRLRAETSFRTPLSLRNSIFFEASYRYYWEPGASDLVQQNDMDKFGYFAAAITMPTGIFASYTTGKLPSDLESDRVYELGFKLNL